MKNGLGYMVNELLQVLGITTPAVDFVDRLLTLSVIIGLALLFEVLSRYVLVPVIQRLVGKTRVTWDDKMFNKVLLRRLLRLLPIFMVYTLISLAFTNKDYLHIVIKLCEIYLAYSIIMFVNSLLKTIFDVINDSASLRDRPMKGLLQILQVTLFFVGSIVIISLVIGKSPGSLLMGLGASAAIIMLVFKDSIVGFVSGIQLSANNMLRPGDWISVPKYGADGTVIEVTLNTVKVRNFDNTITMIPPYALTSDSFQNWRGMEKSDGRRIKRSINIDMNSVKFCTSDMIDKYRKISLLTDYINDTEEELNRHNAEKHLDNAVLINNLRQTNIGVFRAYLDRYLKSLPKVNHNMICMVRQLQPTENGIPVELYFFSAIKEWIPYEHLQADVFDHVLGIIPEFDLHVFQNPSGMDFRMFTGREVDNKGCTIEA